LRHHCDLFYAGAAISEPGRSKLDDQHDVIDLTRPAHTAPLVVDPLAVCLDGELHGVDVGERNGVSHDRQGVV
jgi:hypothetical protein